MRELCIPDHFIGVQSLIAIASLAVHVEVCNQTGTPREGDVRVATVLEVPGAQVV